MEEFKKYWCWIQDSRVKGHALTPSCKSTGITTNFWTIINRDTLELIKKYTSHPKTKKKLQWDGRRGANNKIKSHNHRVCDSQTGEQSYHRSPCTGLKVLSPMSGFPTWGSGNGRRNPQRIKLWRLAGFDCRTLTGLGETETPLLEDTHKVVCTSGPRRKELWPHRTLNQTYLLVLEGLLQRPGLWLITETRTLAAEILGSTPWHEPSQSLPLAPPKSL